MMCWTMFILNLLVGYIYCMDCMRCGIMRFDIRSGIKGPCDDELIE
jgi:hypothetical protein